MSSKTEPIIWCDPTDSFPGCDPKYAEKVYMTQIIDGYGFRVAKDGRTYCCEKGYKGPDEKFVRIEKKPHQDTPTNHRQSDSSGVDDLFQKSQPIETTTPPIMKQNFAPQKGRGRPRKTGEMSRVTAWRRKREEQVRML